MAYLLVYGFISSQRAVCIEAECKWFSLLAPYFLYLFITMSFIIIIIIIIIISWNYHMRQGCCMFALFIAPLWQVEI